MTFFQSWLYALPVILGMMTILWIISAVIRNVSIVDLFWGPGFVLAAGFWYIITPGAAFRKTLVLLLVAVWGFRLAIHLAIRNLGKGEDYRYREFRKKYGEERYWWVSFFQVFLLQGVLMWIIALPLLGAQYPSTAGGPGIFDYAAVVTWLTGFIFEAGGDMQLSAFRADPSNKGKVLDSGFWRYTRHPNYFGDSAVWWAYMLLSFGAGCYTGAAGSIIMTLLILRVSGVALLEKSLVNTRPEYKDYIERTSSFFPLPPRKKKNQPQV